MEPQRHLNGRLIGAAGRPSWGALAQLPTLLQRCPALDQGAARVWVKRDDLSDPRYGGSKVRKLEWALHAAPFDGRTSTILSMGALGSHHLLALAIFGPLRGLDLHALVVDQHPTAHAVRNLAVIASSGARMWHVHRRVGLPLALARYRREVPGAERGTWMPAGASSPIGCLGYVEAGLELGAQIDAGLAPRPSRIYISAGSAGAGAGLLLGLALGGMSTHLSLVSAVERCYFNSLLFAAKVRAVWATLAASGLAEARRQGWRQRVREARISWSIDHRQVGAGYGEPTPRGRAAIERAAGAGLRLEPTYTGKCLAALLEDARLGQARGEVLFWNTHGPQDLQAHVRPDWARALPASLRQVVEGAPS